MVVAPKEIGKLVRGGDPRGLSALLQDKIMGKFQTGNEIYDSVIALCLISSQEVALDVVRWVQRRISHSPKLFWKIYSLVLKAFRYLYRLVRPAKVTTEMIDQTVRIKYITDRREMNTLFEPLMWYLNQLTTEKEEMIISLETTKKNPQVVQQIPKDRVAKFTFLEHVIEYSIKTEIMTLYVEHEQKRENFVITMTTKVAKDRSVDIFEQFSEMAEKKFQEAMAKKEWKQNIYRNEGGKWIHHEAKTTRRIETVILKQSRGAGQLGQMDEIVRDLKTFLQDEEWYLSRDIPYTRRFMFYGTPGTGKSSCIKALACMTQRHIHYLFLSDVKSGPELITLFDTIRKEMPQKDETILVIEDIDCASAIVEKRSGEEIAAEKAKEKAKEKDKEKDKEKEKHEDKKSTLTLSDLLNAIDGGVSENHGQIMIVTTNHPEKLDSALLRAGRIDNFFEFDNCDYQQIEGLYFNFFEQYPEIRLNPNVPCGHISPAEVTGLFLKHKRVPATAWKQMLKRISSGKVRRGFSTAAPRFQLKEQSTPEIVDEIEDAGSEEQPNEAAPVKLTFGTPLELETGEASDTAEEDASSEEVTPAKVASDTAEEDASSEEVTLAKVASDTAEEDASSEEYEQINDAAPKEFEDASDTAEEDNNSEEYEQINDAAPKDHEEFEDASSEEYEEVD